MSFPLGETVTRSALTKVDGLLTDPATLTLTFTDPLGAVTTFTWPAPPDDIVRDTLGTFHKNIVPTVPGLWNVEWVQTGGVSIELPGGGDFVVDYALETVTVHVKDGSDNPVPNVNVQVIIGVGIVAGGYTDAGGDFVCQLPPDDYTVNLVKSKVAFSDPYQVTVLNTGGVTPQTFDLVCTPLVIDAPAAVPRVKLFGFLLGENGQPVDDVRVVVETVLYGGIKPWVQAPSPATGVDPVNVMVRPERRELRTDGAGYWECDVVSDSTVRVEIPDVRFQRIFRVPNDPRVTTLNIRDARQDPGTGTELGVSSDVGDRGVLPGDG